jgi:hypothetical protein
VKKDFSLFQLNLSIWRYVVVNYFQNVVREQVEFDLEKTLSWDIEQSWIFSFVLLFLSVKGWDVLGERRQAFENAEILN